MLFHDWLHCIIFDLTMDLSLNAHFIFAVVVVIFFLSVCSQMELIVWREYQSNYTNTENKKIKRIQTLNFQEIFMFAYSTVFSVIFFFSIFRIIWTGRWNKQSVKFSSWKKKNDLCTYDFQKNYDVCCRSNFTHVIKNRKNADHKVINKFRRKKKE